MATPTAVYRVKQFAALAIVLVLATVIALPSAACAQDSSSSADVVAPEASSASTNAVVQNDSAQDDAAKKVVRVGWFESPFNTTDQFGRRSGYAYDYQRKIAAYTGWTYEYVEGSWSELMKMLKDGKIDLMSDVSYVEGRAKDMLYPSLPMGTEAYYVFVVPDNDEIASNDYSSLNGKTVGVTKDSVQEGLFLEWEQAHGVQANLVELTEREDVSMRILQRGDIDAFITLDAYGDSASVMPVFKIGSSDFYFAVNKNRPDLLSELDAAMNRIQDENKHYHEQMSEKYLRGAGINSYLSSEEKDWLEGHGTIRVGYQDNYLAFCASDEKTGELIGALKDYLAYASTCMENAQIDFEPVAYPTATAALEALKSGEVDCMFPANLSDYDGEVLGMVMTPPIIRTEMDAVVRAADQQSFLLQDHVTVAVNEGNTNYEMFLVENYPGWDIAYFPDTPACLEAVAAGKADCVIISNYRFGNISRQCEKLRLTTVYTGVDMDYYLAVREGNSALYSILTRIVDMAPSSVTNATLTYYSTEDAKVDFAEIIRDNLGIVMTVVAVILAVILVLLLRSIRVERKAREEERLVNDLSKRVFVDALTSVRNKGAYDECIQELQDQVDRGDQVEFAIGVFDCDNLKAINDQFGHDKGDIYLKTASHLICRTFQHCPVFRIGGDEFAAIMQHEDYQNRVDLVDKFDRAQEEMCAAAKNKWEEVHVAVGIAVYDPQTDQSVNDTVRRADKVMYENKRIGKNAM